MSAQAITAVLLQVIGLLSIIYLTSRFLLNLVSRHGELADVDARIKASLREELGDERARHASVMQQVAEREALLKAEAERATTALTHTTEDRDNAVTAAGAAILASDFVTGFVASRLLELTHEEDALIRAATSEFTDTMKDTLIPIAHADTEQARIAATLRAASGITATYGSIVHRALTLARRARATARLAASWVPMALEEAYLMSPSDSADAMQQRITDKYFDGNGPITSDGVITRRLLP